MGQAQLGRDRVRARPGAARHIRAAVSRRSRPSTTKRFECCHSQSVTSRGFFRTSIYYTHAGSPFERARGRAGVVASFMMAALAWWPISLGLVTRAPGRCGAARMVARLDGMVLGEAVSPEVLQQLGVEGKRALVAFFCRDNGHECMQELRDLESRATRYRSDFSCDIVAIRSQGSWVKEDTPSKYPSIRFVCAVPCSPRAMALHVTRVLAVCGSVDEGEGLRRAFRMEIDQINDRQSFLVDAQGRVQHRVESAILVVPRRMP